MQLVPRHPRDVLLHLAHDAILGLRQAVHDFAECVLVLLVLMQLIGEGFIRVDL